ncbi:MAG: hypothetical protein L6R43_12995 [Planctomycetes bacterium]|nr:hypothetical protein [Planctomycetota bacterium]
MRRANVLSPKDDGTDDVLYVLEEYERRMEEHGSDDLVEKKHMGIAEGAVIAAGFVGKMAFRSTKLVLGSLAKLIAELRLIEKVDRAMARRLRRQLHRELHQGERFAELRERFPDVAIPPYRPEPGDNEDEAGAEARPDIATVMDEQPDGNDPTRGWYYPAHYYRPCGAEDETATEPETEKEDD